MISLLLPGKTQLGTARPGRLAWALFALALVGCLPKIGDDCQGDSDCSQIGDRVCDTSQIGGYCTQFNCTPESCPEGEGICVAFSNSPSLASGCADEGRPSPYARSFCMKPCERDGDCRGGYLCIDLEQEDPWAADVIQKPPTSSKVCLVPQSASPVDVDLLSGIEENVCAGPAPDGSGGEGGVGGGGGVGGAGD